MDATSHLAQQHRQQLTNSSSVSLALFDLLGWFGSCGSIFSSVKMPQTVPPNILIDPKLAAVQFQLFHKEVKLSLPIPTLEEGVLPKAFRVSGQNISFVNFVSVAKFVFGLEFIHYASSV